jgi:Flp pilus assembly pilin Flp
MTPSYLRALAANDDGQALVEYGLILLLVATVTVGVLTTLGTSVNSLLSSIAADF